MLVLQKIFKTIKKYISILKDIIEENEENVDEEYNIINKFNKIRKVYYQKIDKKDKIKVIHCFL